MQNITKKFYKKNKNFFYCKVFVIVSGNSCNSQSGISNRFSIFFNNVFFNWYNFAYNTLSVLLIRLIFKSLLPFYYHWPLDEEFYKDVLKQNVIPHATAIGTCRIAAIATTSVL